MPRVKIRSISIMDQWIVRHSLYKLFSHAPILYCPTIVWCTKKKKEDHLEFELHIISDRNQFHIIDINDLDKSNMYKEQLL